MIFRVFSKHAHRVAGKSSDWQLTFMMQVMSPHVVALQDWDPAALSFFRVFGSINQSVQCQVMRHIYVYCMYVCAVPSYDDVQPRLQFVRPLYRIYFYLCLKSTTYSVFQLSLFAATLYQESHSFQRWVPGFGLEQSSSWGFAACHMADQAVRGRLRVGFVVLEVSTSSWSERVAGVCAPCVVRKQAEWGHCCQCRVCLARRARVLSRDAKDDLPSIVEGQSHTFTVCIRCWCPDEATLSRSSRKEEQ
jgi:hypothetical protein